MNKIYSFTDLNTWKEAHELTLFVYAISRKFPKDELFGLTSQLRRSIVSIESNIAEGFGRSSQKDKIHFYTMAKSSLYEAETQMRIARDLKYCTEENFSDFYKNSVIVSKLLSGLNKTASDRI